MRPLTTSETAPAPAALVAATRTSYSAPAISPVSVVDSAGAGTDRDDQTPAGRRCSTAYEVTDGDAEGALQVIVSAWVGSLAAGAAPTARGAGGASHRSTIVTVAVAGDGSVSTSVPSAICETLNSMVSSPS